MSDSSDLHPGPGPTGDGEADRVQAVVRKFGGIRPMASKLEIAFTTVQGWKQRGHIPPSHHGRILDAAAAHGIALSRDDLAPAAPTAPPPEAEPAPAPPPEPEPAPLLPPSVPAGGSRPAALAGAGAGLAVVAVAIVVAVLTAPQWTAWLAGGVPTPDIARLEARVAALEQASDRSAETVQGLSDRLTALEDRMTVPPEQAPAAELAAEVRALTAARRAAERRLDDLAAAVTRAEERLSDLGTRLDAVEARQRESPEATRRIDQALAALDGRLGALERSREAFGFESRLAALEQRAAAIEAAPDAAALVVAVAQLRAALTGSGPYADELAGVRAIAGDDPESAAHLAVLAAHAETGVPTLAVLQSRFAGVATAAVRAAGAPQGEGWVAASIRRLQGLLSWRRTGERAEQAGGVELLLARAEVALGEGDLAGALRLLEGLDGAAAAAAADWLADARARLAADRAVAALTVRAIAVLKDGG